MLRRERFDGRQQDGMPRDGKRVEQPDCFLVGQIGGKVLQAVAGKENDNIVKTHALAGSGRRPLSG